METGHASDAQDETTASGIEAARRWSRFTTRLPIVLAIALGIVVAGGVIGSATSYSNPPTRENRVDAWVDAYETTILAYGNCRTYHVERPPWGVLPRWTAEGCRPDTQFASAAEFSAWIDRKAKAEFDFYYSTYGESKDNVGLGIGIGLLGAALVLWSWAAITVPGVLRWTGLAVAFTVLLPLALLAMGALAAKNSPKTAGSQLKGGYKESWKPDGAPTSRKDAEWRTQFGRGTPQNLWGVYKAPNGQVQMEQRGMTWYLGDDAAWHPLNPERIGPSGAGLYS